MAGGGHIVIRSRIAHAADSDTIRDQLGPIERKKLEAILAQNVADWSNEDFTFVLRCILEAHEAFE